MKKRMMSMMLVICMVLLYVPITVFAASTGTTEEGLRYSISDTDEVTIIAYSGSADTITIPNEIEGKPVTSIFNSAFSGRTVTSITFTTPSSVTFIGDSAFANCTNLASITIPDSVTTIKEHAFKNCTGLTSITIPRSVTFIGDGAFTNTPWLSTKQNDNPLVVVNSILIDGSTATGDVSILDGVTTIGDKAFYNCTGLTSVTIPGSVTTIGSGTFSGCTGLTDITIPGSVTTIGSSAFGGCTNLTSIDIHEGVTTIGSSAFSGCTGLTSITIPRSVTFIGDGAFENTPWLSTKQNDNPLVVVNSILIDGSTATGEVSIPSGVTTIGSSAFNSCTGLTNIIIPSSVISIGDKAFYKCTNLESVIIPGSITSIGDGAFFLCTSLESVTIPNSVTCIGNSTFAGCAGLTSVTISNSVTTIGNETFQRCTSLTSVTIPNSVTSIGDRAFQHCTGLTSVTIPNGVTSIGNSAFYECTNLESVTIPSSVTTIGEEAFYNCTNLESVTIPGSVTTIEGQAFFGCTGLTSVTILDGVTTIGGYSFRGCTSLASITIPGSVISIKEAAFANCESLGGITIPNGVASIEYGVFYGCSSLGSIFLPNKESLSIGDDAIPDTTSQVKYSVTNNEVTITKIALGTDKSSVDIPATICGDPVVAVATEYQGKVGAHTHDLSNIPAKAATVTETGNKEYWHCEICGKNFSDENGGNEIADLEAWKTGDGKLDKLPLEITVGAGQSVTAGKKKELTFRSNAAYSEFARVELDGVTVNAENYTVTEGSTIVTLKADYVASLSAGRHTIGIVSTSGTATAQFTVSTASTGGSYAHTHKLTPVEEKPATCTTPGNKAYYVCSGCGYWYEDASGRVRITDYNSVVIPQIASVKLSVSSYTYNGKTASPTVMVEDSAGNRLVENTDYTVTVPTGRKNAGTYSYVVDFKGNYEGSQELTLTIQKASYTPTAKSYTGTYNGKKHSITLKGVKSGSTILYRTSPSKSWTTTKPSRTSVGKTTVYYKITNKNYQTITGYKTIVMKPKKTQVTGLNRGEKSFEVIWAKKTTQTTGYQIQYSTSSTFKSRNKTVTVASNTTTRKTINNLQAKKRYYVRVRTYKTVNGVRYYSEWSAKKTVTTR